MKENFKFSNQYHSFKKCDQVKSFGPAYLGVLIYIFNGTYIVIFHLYIVPYNSKNRCNLHSKITERAAFRAGIQEFGPGRGNGGPRPLRGPDHKLGHHHSFLFSFQPRTKSGPKASRARARAHIYIYVYICIYNSATVQHTIAYGLPFKGVHMLVI